MTFKLKFENDGTFPSFMLENPETKTMFGGTIYDYNNIEFLNDDGQEEGGMEKFLTGVMMYNKGEVELIVNLLDMWAEYLSSVSSVH